MTPRWKMLALATCLLGLLGADWPQFLGPQRNCTSTEKGLLQTWGEKGPAVLWQKDVGEGFSAPVVAGERLILFHRVGDEEVVECLNAATGKPMWKHRASTKYRDALGKGDGPRSTPLIAGERVYTLSPGGRLLCLKLADGEKVWQRELLKDYNVPRSYFGVGTSPILESGRVLVNVGARDAGIVAFDKDNGKEVWKATGDGASYSSPSAATIDGVRHVFFFTRQGIVSLGPGDGKGALQQALAFAHGRLGQRGDAGCGGRLLCSSPLVMTPGRSWYGRRRTASETLWSNDRSLSCHFSTPVYHEGYLFGFDGRAESGTEFRCVEVKNGKVHWSKEGFGCGSMILAEGNLIVLSESGDLVLVECKSDKYHEKARASVLTGPCRAHMALANGRLYARDNRKVVCWNLKK